MLSISAAQNSEPEVEKFEYPKAKQDELIDDFKLYAGRVGGMEPRAARGRREQMAPAVEDSHRLRSLVDWVRCARRTGDVFGQTLTRPQSAAGHRSHKPAVAFDEKRTGLIVDYFGVFANLEKALNFDENIREESPIDWDALRATVPGEVARCMAPFEGIAISDTRECLLTALRRLREADVAKTFEQNFKSLERLWEAVAPDPCLYPHRYQYNWLCSIYVAHRRRQRGSRDTYGELSAKTRELI